MRALRELIHDIHRRSLWQVMAVYLGACWAALEVVDLLVDTSGLPGWIPPVALTALVLGFPVVLATAVVRDVPQDSSWAPGSDPRIRQVPPEPRRLSMDPRRILVVGVLVAAVGWGAVAGIDAVRSDVDTGAAEASRASTGEKDLDRERGAAAAPVPDRPSVAVLPFTNRSPDPAHAFFADGVHENVVVALARIASLDVRSQRSVARFRDTSLPLRDIADELQVTTLLEGSVHRAGGRIRVIAHLVDPSTGRPLWSQTYERAADDIFAVQTDVATRVAAALEAALTPGELARIRRPPTGDLGAYDFYLRGREAYQRFTPESNDEARRLFRAAVGVDPEFAAAWAGIGDTFLVGIQFYGSPEAFADSGRIMAERAITLDPELAQAHKTLAFAFSMERRHRRSLASNLRAVELAPDFADAINNVGFAYFFLGDIPSALHWVERSQRLQPNVTLLRSNVGALKLLIGDTAVARRYLNETLALDPSNPGARNWRVALAAYVGDPGMALELAERFVSDENPLDLGRAAFAAMLARDFEAAVGYAERAMLLAPGSDIVESYPIENVLGASLMALGRTEEARPHLDAVMLRSTSRIDAGADGWQPLWALAAAAASLGHADAMERIDTALERGFNFLPILVHSPAFDSFRSDPRFLDRVEDARARIARQHHAADDRPAAVDGAGGLPAGGLSLTPGPRPAHRVRTQIPSPVAPVGVVTGRTATPSNGSVIQAVNPMARAAPASTSSM